MRYLKTFEGYTYEQDQHGKHIVWKNDDVFICVDSIDDASYITLWENGKKLGALSLEGEYNHNGKIYRKVSYIEIHDDLQGLGYGKRLYDVALKYLRKDIKGITSHLPDRTNKKQIPAIYKRLGSYTDDEDYEFIDRKESY